jgi:hypothetical protein
MGRLVNGCSSKMLTLTHTRARAIPHSPVVAHTPARFRSPTAALARPHSPAAVLNKYLPSHLVAAAASLCGRCRQGARGIYSLRITPPTESVRLQVAQYAPLRVLQISRRTHEPRITVAIAPSLPFVLYLHHHQILACHHQLLRPACPSSSATAASCFYMIQHMPPPLPPLPPPPSLTLRLLLLSNLCI